MTVSRDGSPAAEIKLPSPSPDQSFLTADDDQGGTVVFPVPVSLDAFSTAVQATVAAALQPLAEAGRTTNVATVADGAAASPAIAGEYNAAVFQPSQGGTVILPAGYAAGFLQGAADGTLLDQAQGDAVLVAGAGADMLQSATAGDTLIGGSGSDLLVGGPDGSVLIGSSGDSVLIGGSGPAPLGGSALASELSNADGGSGGAFAAITNALALGDPQPAFLTALIDVAQGSAGQAGTLRGLGAQAQASGAGDGGSTTFLAGSGHDLIVGDSGADRIQAGTGSAVVLAGTGDNVFAFVDGSAGGIDLIAGFKLGADTISLRGYGPDAVPDALQSETVRGGAMFLTLPDATRIALLGVHGGLTAASFG